MIVFPNAKINIGLDIVGRRPDGYHDIVTVMVPVGWSDILEVVPAKGMESTLTVTGRHVDCPPEKNLVMKAYRRMASEVEIPPVDIYLHKIIPDGAGLGGGSSDAAFMLKALNDMFALGFSHENLASMASDIGADCPFFIYDKPMLAEGIGTTLSPFPLSLSGKSVVIVKPDVSISTKEAYGGVTPCVADVKLSDSLLGSGSSGWQVARVKNDFEKSVFPNHPQLADIKNRIIGLGAEYAAMSGSGSAIYGIFDGDKLSENYNALFPEMDIFVGSVG